MATPEIIPNYQVKITQPNGDLVYDGLPVSGVSFTESLKIPNQINMDTATIDLIPSLERYAWLQDIYDQLDSYQKVIIYEADSPGTPRWQGYIDTLPTQLSANKITCYESLNLLTKRKLAHLQMIGSGVNSTFNTISDQINWLTDTWEPDIKDNFAQYTDYTDFANNAGWYDQVNSSLVDLNPFGEPPNVFTNTGYIVSESYFDFSSNIATQTAEAKLECDFYAPLSVDFTYRFALGYDPGLGGLGVYNVDLAKIGADDHATLSITRSDGVEAFTRDLGPWELAQDEWHSLTIWIIKDTGVPYSYQVEIWLNSRQVAVASGVIVAATGTGRSRFRLEAVNGTLTISKVIVWKRQSYLGYSNPSNDLNAFGHDETEYPGDTQLQAILALATLHDQEIRMDHSTNTMTIDSSIGVDRSVTHKFVEGTFSGGFNLAALDSQMTGQGIITSLGLRGSGADQNTRLASAYDFDAWDTYGIIEDEFNDKRVTINTLARSVAKNRLDRNKASRVSLSGRLRLGPNDIDTLRPGDQVWIQSDRLNINRPARLLQLSWRTGSNLVDAVFDGFVRSRNEQLMKAVDNIGKLYRSNRSGQSEYTIPFTENKSLFIDDFDSRLQYSEGSWESLTGAFLETCYGSTLHWTNDLSDTVMCEFGGRGLYIYVRRAGNIAGSSNNVKDFNIDIDSGTVTATADGYSASTQDRYRIYGINTLTPSYHNLTLGTAGSADLNIYINIDAIRIASWYWPVFIEGDVVNKAILEWTPSRTNAPIKVYINDVDRTADLGGGSGFTGAQSINVFSYLSRPGAHTIEFEPDISDVEANGDFELEAKLNLKVAISQ